MHTQKLKLVGALLLGNFAYCCFHIHILKNVGGPHLWEALGPGLLGLCLKMALVCMIGASHKTLGLGPPTV